MKKDQNGFGAPAILIVILVIALIGGIGWYLYDKNQKPEPKKVVAVKKTSVSPKPAEKPDPVTTISDSLKENIAAAIESKNTAALEGYMTDSVTVVLAASEKGGAVSKTQAIQDLDYLNNATAPWDFALSEDTLTSYKNGFYKDYFGDMTLAGKSTDDFVVSFHVNESGKIDKIFMAANADLLV